MGKIPPTFSPSSQESPPQGFSLPFGQFQEIQMWEPDPWQLHRVAGGKEQTWDSSLSQ